MYVRNQTSTISEAQMVELPEDYPLVVKYCLTRKHCNSTDPLENIREAGLGMGDCIMSNPEGGSFRKNELNHPPN